MKLSKIDPVNKPQTILVFGPPKSGKTEEVGQLAEFFKLIWVDCENGIITLANNLPPEWQENIEVISLPDSRGFPIALETINKILTGKKQVICDKHGKSSCPICPKDPEATYVEVELSTLGPDTVLVIDSLTQLSESAYSYAVKDLKEGGLVEFSHWAAQGAALTAILSKIQQAPCHVVCITHEQGIEMNDKTEKIVPMCGTKNLSRNLAKYFSHVVYCEVKNKGYKKASSAAYNTKILAGSRANIALESDSSLGLVDMIRGNKQKQLSSEQFEEINMTEELGTPIEKPKPSWKKQYLTKRGNHV